MWKDTDVFRQSLFDEIDREFVEAEEMLNRMFKTAMGLGPEELAAGEPYFYRYQISVGPDGKPHIREFGNVKPSAKGLVAPSQAREPLVDAAVNNEENLLTITAELPGVAKQDIKVSVSEGNVTIHAEKGDKKYHTEIPFDLQLDDKSAKAIYANGILELKIKLKSAPKPKRTDVKVE